MMYDGYGGAGFLMLLLGLFWLALIVLIVWLVMKLWPGAGRPQDGVSTPPPPPPAPAAHAETPEQALDRMFALGEIDEATYRSRRTALAEMKKQP